VRDVKLMNLSLLTKWKWTLIKEEGSLWKRVIEDKYGEGDLSLLEEGSGVSWFKSEVVRKMGDGSSTCFWKDKWRSIVPLCDIFPRLFALSMQKDCCVRDVGFSSEGDRRWYFVWRRDLFVWETDLHNLLRMLEGVVLGEGRDEWR